MFIPSKEQIEAERVKRQQSISDVALKSGHLVISSKVMDDWLISGTYNVLMVYYPDRKSLLIADANDTVFKQLHKASQHLMKEKTGRGDRSISLQELLIDHEIDSMNRKLEYEIQAGLGILKINI